MRSADTELPNAIELPAMVSEIAAPKQSPCNIHAAITISLAASHSKPTRINAHGNTRWQQSCSHSNAICNHRFKKRIELRTQNTEEENIRGWNDRNRNRRTQEVPFIAGCNHFTRKNTRFRPRLPPQHKPHARNAFCSMTWQTRMYLRTWQHQMTTIMQPFQCDLQPQIQETHRTTHTGTTTRCRTQRRKIFADETTVAATAAHRRHLSSPAATTLHGKTQGFVLRLPPQHKPHAAFMQPSQCVLQSRTTLPSAYCYVMYSLTPPFIEYIVTWCNVSHHPSLSVFLCDVTSHTTLHWVYCYMMSSLTPPFIECIDTWCTVLHHPSLSVFLCDVKSHTTFHWVVSHHPSLSVFSCDVKSHTTLHQVKVIRSSEDCFPTSFDHRSILLGTHSACCSFVLFRRTRSMRGGIGAWAEATLCCTWNPLPLHQWCLSKLA